MLMPAKQVHTTMARSDFGERREEFSGDRGDEGAESAGTTLLIGSGPRRRIATPQSRSPPSSAPRASGPPDAETSTPSAPEAPLHNAPSRPRVTTAFSSSPYSSPDPLPAVSTTSPFYPTLPPVFTSPESEPTPAPASPVCRTPLSPVYPIMSLLQDEEYAAHCPCLLESIALTFAQICHIPAPGLLPPEHPRRCR